MVSEASQLNLTVSSCKQSHPRFSIHPCIHRLVPLDSLLGLALIYIYGIRYLACDVAWSLWGYMMGPFKIIIPSGVPPARKERSWMWESWSLLFGSAVVLLYPWCGFVFAVCAHSAKWMWFLIDFSSKTYPNLIQHETNMCKSWGLGEAGNAFLVMGMLLAGPMDAGSRCWLIWDSFCWFLLFSQQSGAPACPLFEEFCSQKGFKICQNH
jgi:hypothetical protein